MQNLNHMDGNEEAGTAIVRPQRGSITFSVVIPAFNEERIIGQCLDSIAGLQYPHQKFEVVVMDNGSSDRTREIADSYRESMNITVLHRPKINISALRNAGAAASSGEYLIFLDADMIVPENWLLEAEKLFISSDAGVIGGCFRVPEHSSWVARIWFGRKAKIVNLSPSYVPSGNLMIRRSQFFAIGGFDESLETSEDCDFSCRARALGMNLAEFDAISVVHLGSPQTLRAFFAREIWHGSSVFRVFLLNFRNFQNAKPIAFAIYTLACLLMIVATAAISVYRGSILLVPLFVGMLLVAPLLLALRDVRHRKWRDFPGLAILFLVYGIARAISLVGYRNRRTRRDGRTNVLQAAS
jgi:glycosyltransferase involved in cell wall biosynthesis